MSDGRRPVGVLGHDDATPAPDVPVSSGRRLATGSLTVAAGLLVTGTATLAMLTVADGYLNKTEAAAFNVWWVVTTLLTTGFGVFEAYMTRLVVVEIAAGRSPDRVTGIMAARCWLVAGGVGLVTLVLSPWLSGRLFGHHLPATLLLAVFVMVSATQAIQRGSATGHSRFHAIAAQLSTDGLLRITLTLVVCLSGHASVNLIALGTCVAAAGGVLAGQLTCPQWLVRPVLHGGDIPWRPILLLLAGAVCPVLATSGPSPWLKVFGHVTPAVVTGFTTALILSSIPTQFVSAAFGPLLSQLAHAIEAGDETTFRRLRRGADAAAIGLGAVFVLGFTLLGGWATGLVDRHKGAPMSAGILAVLAVASALTFVAVVRQAGLAAMNRWSAPASAWSLGLVALAIVLVLPFDALWVATAARVAAIGTALVVMTLWRVSGTVGQG